MSVSPSSSSPLAAPALPAKTATSLPAPTVPPATIVEISPAARKALAGLAPQPANIIWGSAPNR